MRATMEKNTVSGGLERATSRTDMDAVGAEIYRNVVAGCHFCLGVVTLEKSLFGKSLKYRLNQEFATPGAADFIRRKFKTGTLDALFSSGPGLEVVNQLGLYRVKSPEYGLPVNSIVGLFQGPKPEHRGVVVFGGERLEGRLESKIDALEKVLGGDGSIRTARGGVVPAGPGLNKLLEELKTINPKRLFDHELNKLAELVNHLEEHKDQIPKPFRPRYTLLHEYVLKKRLGRRGE